MLIALFFSGSMVFAAAPHDDGRTRCLDCHVTLPLKGAPLLFHVDIHDVCAKCHKNYSCSHESAGGDFQHPVSVVPSFKMPADMPLDEKNRMGCITCHHFHDANMTEADRPPYLLRRPPGPAFCVTCHGKL
ncbi:MAG: hypothetical protein HY885_15930 [Deltaproteobacteria bacterium]|nr:hypothetical protein [Deltaproteobacteria bacterium]